MDYSRSAIGVLTITPPGNGDHHSGYRHQVFGVDLAFVDRFMREPHHLGDGIRGGSVGHRDLALCQRKAGIRCMSGHQNLTVHMKKIALMGRSEAGKTTLTQALKGERRSIIIKPIM